MRAFSLDRQAELFDSLDVRSCYRFCRNIVMNQAAVAADLETGNDAKQPVLILGAGINGACVARELVLNGIPVVLVDHADIAYGATAKSSRLIHGGLRYLEYGDVRLVRESLEERARLMELASDYVRPLEIAIPVRHRWGGLCLGALRFLRLDRLPLLRGLAARMARTSERGLWAIRIGLTLYDWLARHGSVPRHRVELVQHGRRPSVPAEQFRWLCRYWDAQMAYPERFVVALLKDAEETARTSGTAFQLLTYHTVCMEGREAILFPVVKTRDEDSSSRPETMRVIPRMIVNATGAWGDWTLDALGIEAPQLLGGTRGSHIVSRCQSLREALGECGIYSEAADGRLVFILPWGRMVLIGTTDERFNQLPDCAVATEDEIEYLIEQTHRVFPQIQFDREDVVLHYSGVRPLPFVPDGKPGAIPRGHWIDRRVSKDGTLVLSLIGGKLTTCRALGEQVADEILREGNLTRIADTKSRPISACLSPEMQSTSTEARQGGILPCPEETLGAVRKLMGDAGERLLYSICSQESQGTDSPGKPAGQELLSGTALPMAFVDWIIEQEWVTGIGDLVERRLGLVWESGCSRETLEQLEQRIIALRGSCRDDVTMVLDRLRRFYGLELPSASDERRFDSHA